MNTYLNTSSIEKGSITKDMLEDDVVSSLEILESNASSTKAGLMSAEDKTKLDGLATVATSGSYNDLSDKPTIQDTTYTPATTTKMGLMSAEDKTKLDGFGSANDYATKDYVNEQIGNINTILEEIINM